MFLRRDVDVEYVEKVCSCKEKNEQDMIDTFFSSS